MDNILTSSLLSCALLGIGGGYRLIQRLSKDGPSFTGKPLVASLHSPMYGSAAVHCWAKRDGGKGNTKKYPRGYGDLTIFWGCVLSSLFFFPIFMHALWRCEDMMGSFHSSVIQCVAHRTANMGKIGRCEVLTSSNVAELQLVIWLDGWFNSESDALVASSSSFF